jgi:hypothetical protein
VPVPPDQQPPGVTLPGEQPPAAVPGDPDAGSGAEPSQPVPPQAPPDTPVSDATSNEVPVLPHSATAGAARAHAAFALAIDIGTNADDPAAALQQILALMAAMLADVARFVPAAMQQTAADQVQAVADQLPQ